jgi:hypothetical protein
MMATVFDDWQKCATNLNEALDILATRQKRMLHFAERFKNMDMSVITKQNYIKLLQWVDECLELYILIGEDMERVGNDLVAEMVFNRKLLDVIPDGVLDLVSDDNGAIGGG